jgi:hypothetical protein
VYCHCQVVPSSASGRPKKPRYDVDANLASCPRASKVLLAARLHPAYRKHKILSYLSRHRAGSVSPWLHRLILGRSSASLTAQTAPPHAMRTELQYIYIPARRNILIASSLHRLVHYPSRVISPDRTQLGGTLVAVLSDFLCH